MSNFEFNLDLSKVKAANEAIAQKAQAKWGDQKDTRITYMDQVGKSKNGKENPDQIFYRLIPFDLTPTNGLVYFDQIGWFLEYNRVVSALSIGEPDEAHDMYLLALEMAKSDEGIAAILHKDNYAKFQYSSQYLAPIIVLNPILNNGIFEGEFEVDPDPKKAIRLGLFRESLWTQVMSVVENAFNNPGKTVYGPDARIWQSFKTNKNNQVRYETERIEFTWSIENNPKMSEAHMEEMASWQAGGAYEFFKDGVTPAAERLEWMQYIFQGGARPASARPLKEAAAPKPGFGGGGGLMGKLKK